MPSARRSAPAPRPDSAPRGAAVGTADGEGVGRPRALTAALVGLALEALAFAVGFVLVIVEVVRGGSDAVGASIALGVLALLVAAMLVLCGRALAAGERWGRAPLATWQLLQSLVAFSWWQGSGSGWAVVVVVFSLAIFVPLMLPGVVRFTTRSGRGPR